MKKNMAHLSNTETTSKPSASKSVRLVVDFKYEPELMHDTDEESINWFFDEILMGEELIVHSNEIGDQIGTMRVTDMGLKAKTPPQSNIKPSKAEAKD